MRQLINRLLIEFDDLKSKKTFNNGSQRSEEIIINKCNRRVSNLLIYNVPESTSDNSADRHDDHDSKLVSDYLSHKQR